MSFLFAWNDDFWSKQVPHTVDFLAYYVAILFLIYFPSLTARVYVLTSVHYITALVSLYVSPTAVLTGIKLEMKEEWLWERPSQ